MLIRIVEGAAQDREFATPHETKECRIAYRPQKSVIETQRILVQHIFRSAQYGGSFDCDTLGRTRWMLLMTKWIQGEVVGGGSNPWMICKCRMAAMCIFIVDTDTVCARWAVYKMSVHSCAGNGAMLSWLQKFRNDLWAD